MADYPDWTRLFQLVGTEITIPINIESSDVTLHVDISTVSCTLYVTLVASYATVNINITGSAITMDVNIESQDANITFEFADQSVAVFDAAKWFAHNAQQIFATGTVTLASQATGTVVSRTVPADKVFYIGAVSIGNRGYDRSTPDLEVSLYVGAAMVVLSATRRGTIAILDVPVRATEGQVATLQTTNLDSATAGFWGTLIGYDEVVE